MRFARLLLCALVLAGCGAGAQGKICGTFDACTAGLACVHGGPQNLGTCELRCSADTDCPAAQHCELVPLPDALANVCAPGPRLAADLVLADVRRDGETFELSGEAITVGELFALVGASSGKGLVRVAGPQPAECDHCVSPRYVTTVLHAAPLSPIVAVGGVAGSLPRARAERFEVASPDSEWKRELAVDLEGNGSFEVERVVRCDRTAPSGCSDRVCDRICRATRTVGDPAVRAQSCAGFIPDVDDCVPE
jgi:hypothetical protein